VEDSRELKQLHHINDIAEKLQFQNKKAVLSQELSNYFIAQVSRSVVQYLKLEPWSRYRLAYCDIRYYRDTGTAYERSVKSHHATATYPARTIAMYCMYMLVCNV